MPGTVSSSYEGNRAQWERPRRWNDVTDGVNCLRENTLGLVPSLLTIDLAEPLAGDFEGGNVTYLVSF
jgi:hypothetical protein